MSEMNSCLICATKNKNSLKKLNKDELKGISDKKKYLSFKKGEIIFEEGSTILGVYCIKEGVAKLTKLSSNGKSQILRFNTEGSILGDTNIVLEEFANLTATAVTNMQVCFIPKDEIVNFFTTNTHFSLEIFRKACEKLKNSDNMAVDFTQKSVKQRLASSLLFLENTFGKDENGFINIQLSREEISNIVGTATESLIRMLSDFNKNNFIETKLKKIKIINHKMLEKITDLDI